MKTIQKISALLMALAPFSMAGVINVYKDGEKNATVSLNLTTIDSLTFSGKAEKKEMNISGKAKQAIKLSDMDRMAFTLKDKSKETMTVTVGEGVLAGNHTFKLSEIKNIEIVEMDAEEDMDGDGLTDLEEIYKYDTNPKAADTDGDGWSDGEELADGMYSPTNPTKFNPRIADVPGLRVTLKKTPGIWLNVTTSEGKNESETVSEGMEVSKTNSTSYEQTRSADIMHAQSASTTLGTELGIDGDGVVAKFVGNVTVGYNGSYTSSTGMTWGSSEEKSVAEKFEKAIAKEKSEGSEVSGATLCMQVELKNTSDIAFTIEALKLSASTYDIKDTSTLTILADLSRDGSLIWSNITLKPGESTDANFCNSEVPVELIKNLIYNTSSIVLGSSTQKITIDGGKDDFTVAYTKVAAKTADFTIDYGPGSSGNPSVRYLVATNYRYNPDHKGTDDMYAQTSLAELLRNAHVNFKQDSVEGPSKKKLYGLASIDEYKFNLADSAMWFVTVQRAADIKKGLNTMALYSIAYASYDLEKIFVGAGDAVHIFYSKDQDHDGVPLPTEYLFGTDDKKADSDGDGLSDYDEIIGWTKGESTVKIYTNPANDDTDGDGLNDKEDPEPTKRAMFEDASLSILKVLASDPSEAGASALLSKDSIALAKANNFDVFVQAPSAFIKVTPNAKKVAWLKFTTDKTMQYVQPTVESGKNVYTFRTPEQLSILDTTRVKIEVKSEDEATVKTYTLSITSALMPPTNLTLGKNVGRSQIIVNFDRSKDSRVKGYVILRGDSAATLPDRIENKVKMADSVAYNGFVPTMRNADENSYPDKVGEGSPYYAYRVYAYGKEGDDMVFSTGTDQHVRSVGRLKVDITFTDVGSEYWYYERGSDKCRTDLTTTVTLLTGKRALVSWYVFDYDAGYNSFKETVIWYSQALADGKTNGEDQIPKGGPYTFNIGSEGLYLDINSFMYCSQMPERDFAQQGISWPYAQMADDLNGDGVSGNAPKQGENRFLIGQGGIKYNDTDGICDESSCGPEPHSGYKFNIHYDFVDDDDLY
ncbi:hypothetical protein [Fibrobacter succinogenes]|uniref:hypothetical protein n=1 Tax=Fibrobacter succinogenes TaxID=833 RepID=UPI001568DCAE|nr:hypothetical protein [Fibrobacter succinogenes]